MSNVVIQTHSTQQEIPLSKTTKFIVDNRGRTAPTEKSGIPLIATNCISNNNLYPVYENLRYVSQETYDNWFRSHPEPGDLLLTLKGSQNGAVCLVPDPVDFVIAQDMVALRVDEKVIDPLYLFAALRSDDVQAQIKNLDVSGVIPHLKKSDFDKLMLPYPEKDTQRSIGQIYFYTSKKIDLLHRQNQTLEAMAATLFRQWFVEEAQEDWEEVALEDVTSRITDGAHASPPTVEVGLPMASVKDMYQWGINTASCRQISQDDFDELVRTDCRPLKNDILIAKDGSYLKHVFVAEDDMDVVILSSIAILRPNEKYHPLLLATFLKLDSTRQGLANIVTGAVIPRIVLKDFRKYKLLLPLKQSQDQALSSIQPLYEKCWENDRQIRTLENLRDTLLPKLMSGEVRVAA